MLKIVFLFLLMILVNASLFSAEVRLQTGVNGNVGWIYAAEFAPGFNGGGLDVGMRWSMSGWFLNAKLTGETAPIGSEVILLTGAGIPLVKDANWQLEGALSALWGLALFKPLPLFEIGLDLDICWSFFFTEGFGVYADAGLRYLYCPEYSSKVSFYQAIDTPIGAGVVFRWN